jgi:hypothetical protein
MNLSQGTHYTHALVPGSVWALGGNRCLSKVGSWGMVLLEWRVPLWNCSHTESWACCRNVWDFVCMTAISTFARIRNIRNTTSRFIHPPWVGSFAAVKMMYNSTFWFLALVL